MTAMSAARARELIETLKLQPHPEGGWYGEVFRSASSVTPADGRPPRARPGRCPIATGRAHRQRSGRPITFRKQVFSPAG